MRTARRARIQNHSMGPLISRRLDGQLPMPTALPPVSRRHSTFSAPWFSGSSERPSMIQWLCCAY